MTAPATRFGFYGKLPSRGDFVRASLSRSLTDAWHRWLQPLLPAAQDRLGDAWADVWPAMRPWHFALPAGLCGMAPVGGVWLASADKVGRAFPLAIMTEAPPCLRFLEAAEGLGREAIDGCLAPDTLARRLSELPRPSVSVAPSCIRWWRSGESDARSQCRDRLPDLDGFVGMLTP